MTLPAKDMTIFDAHTSVAAGQKTLSATYTRPYQAHASIGPSCAVAQFEDGSLTVWSHTQGVYPDRQAIAEMLASPSSRCAASIWRAQAATVTTAPMMRPRMPPSLRGRCRGGRCACSGRSEQEHGWEPYGPAMVTKVSAALDADGSIVDLGLRGVEQHPFHASWRGRRAHCGAILGAAPSQSPSPSQFLSRKAAATAMPLRSTSCRTRG